MWEIIKALFVYDLLCAVIPMVIAFMVVLVILIFGAYKR